MLKKQKEKRKARGAVFFKVFGEKAKGFEILLLGEREEEFH